jgi:hypothetical protein
MIKNRMWPVHPGEVLFEEFMKLAEPLINANMLAKALDVPANRIYGHYQRTARHHGRYRSPSGDVVRYHS